MTNAHSSSISPDDAAIYAAFDAARADDRPYDALRIAYNRQDLFEWSGEIPDDFTDEEAITVGLG